MPDTDARTACIIPAYDEQETVATIATLAASHPLVHSVTVVDDGSTDATSDRAASVDGVRVVRLDENRGKGAALHAGLDATDEPIVLFLDADLIGLTHNHISDLLAPVLSGEADMAVGVFRGGRLHTDLAHIVTPSLSGQRAIRRSVLANLDMDSVRFGIERALTELWETGSIKVRTVVLRAVTHRTKEEKRGWIVGVLQRLGMFRDIARFETNRLGRRIRGKDRSMRFQRMDSSSHEHRARGSGSNENEDKDT
jgi:glycosyltransferase involved in cell wall biosynthesis